MKTQEEELEAAALAFARTITRIIQRGAGAEYYDQSNSPLGRAKHLELAREQRIEHVREGRRVLMKRADVDTYLARKRTPLAIDATDDDAVERVIAETDKRASKRRKKAA